MGDWPACFSTISISRKVLNTRKTLPTQPTDLGVSQTPKPEQINGEKTPSHKKCPVDYFRPLKIMEQT